MILYNIKQKVIVNLEEITFVQAYAKIGEDLPAILYFRFKNKETLEIQFDHDKEAYEELRAINKLVNPNYTEKKRDLSGDVEIINSSV